MTTAPATTIISPQEYLGHRSAETVTDTTASNEWFEYNRIDATPRNVVTGSKFISGIINFGIGTYNWFRGMNPAETVMPIGGNQLMDSARTFAESSLISTDKYEEAKKSAKTLKYLAIASVLPLAALAMTMTTPWVLGLAGAGVLGYFRYRAAKSVEKQVDILGHPERAAIGASEKWFGKNKKALELPQKMRNLERFAKYGEALLYGAGAVITVFTNPLTALLLALGSSYSFWQGHMVLPDIITYYEKMSSDTKRSINQRLAQHG